ncbi:MAG: M14 family metallocarboxypeptidase [Candidatus Poribacteria bacterium]|nr:M14 family metallocarboxypeptidase [Candidatus Poribacteria bacterium]
MKATMQRDYSHVTQRLASIHDLRIRIEELEQADGYPLFGVSIGDPSLPAIYISAGIHGNEPSGVEMALRWIEDGHAAWSDRIRFEILPCNNPRGWVNDVRENGHGIDLNWAFDRDDLPEIRAIRRFIKGKRFAAVIDLHEDWESPGFYLYELNRRQRYLSDAIMERVAAVCPINRNDVIEGENAVNGALHPDLNSPRRQLRGSGVPVALFDEHTDHLMTTEAPTDAPLETRVAAHLAVIETVVHHYADGK